MAKKPPDVPPNALALYDKVVAQFPDVERKGAKSAYTSLNGHMFSFMTTEGALCLRLDEDAKEAFMAKHGTGPVIQYGATMRGYVEVPAAMLAKTKQVAKVFQASLDYVGSLKPKPTKRKKTAKKKTAKKKASKKKASKKAAKKK